MEFGSIVYDFCNVSKMILANHRTAGNRNERSRTADLQDANNCNKRKSCNNNNGANNNHNVNGRNRNRTTTNNNNDGGGNRDNDKNGGGGNNSARLRGE